MKQIQLTQGKFALVDDEDFERLNEHKWYALKGGRCWYAVRNSPRRNRKRSRVYMHRVILNAPGSLGVDHIDGAGLNNCRHNLRLATHAQNMRAHQNKRDNCSSMFRGVFWSKARQKWRTRIKVGGKSIYLGYFESENEAAKAYDEASKKYFGEFASPNFQPEPVAAAC